MQIFTNGKRRFCSFIEFYVIHLTKNQRVKFDHSTTNHSMLFLAYGWRAWNWNWPIRSQQGENCPDVIVSLRERNWKQATFHNGDGIKSLRKRICSSQTVSDRKMWKLWNTWFCVFKFLIWRQKWVAFVRHGNLQEVRRVSPGRMIVVLFWTKHVVPRPLNPEFSS